MASHREHQGSISSSVPPVSPPGSPAPGLPLFLLACLRKLRSRTRLAHTVPWPLFSKGNRTRVKRISRDEVNFLEFSDRLERNVIRATLSMRCRLEKQRIICNVAEMFYAVWVVSNCDVIIRYMS